MQAVPALQLVVITKPINEVVDPGCEWTYKSGALFKTEFPTRYHLFQLRAFDYALRNVDETVALFPNVDIHSKMFIVDDVFMSVGSANKNRTDTPRASKRLVLRWERMSSASRCSVTKPRMASAAQLMHAPAAFRHR